MATQTLETILKSFQVVQRGDHSGGEPATVDRVWATALSQLPGLLEESTRRIEAFGAIQDEAAAGNTRAVLSASNGSGAATTDGGGGVSAGSVVSTVLRSGFGLVPLIGNLLGLFGGGGGDPATPLIRYAAPATVQVNAAQWGGAMGPAEYDQAGELRPFVRAELAKPPTAPASTSTAPMAASRATATSGDTPAQPVINVNVQAMDSRSFLDHSQEIARAVREAMLNLNAINDVVNDL